MACLGGCAEDLHLDTWGKGGGFSGSGGSLCGETFLWSHGLVELPELFTSVATVVVDLDGFHDLAVYLLSVVPVVQASTKTDAKRAGRFEVDEEPLDGLAGATILSVDHVDVVEFPKVEPCEDPLDFLQGGVWESARDCCGECHCVVGYSLLHCQNRFNFIWVKNEMETTTCICKPCIV